VAAPTLPWVSVRCWVWHAGALVLALTFGTLVAVFGVEAVGCVGAVGCVEAVGRAELVVAVPTLGDVVDVCARDEVAAVGLDVEPHPDRKDVVITISPATIGIEFFISPTFIDLGARLHYTTMTHDRLIIGENCAVCHRHLHGVEPARRPKRYQRGSPDAGATGLWWPGLTAMADVTSAGLEQSEYRERQRPWRQHRSVATRSRPQTPEPARASILHGQRDVGAGA